MLPLVLAAPLWPQAQAKDGASDRACLKDIMTRYLASLVAHDPKQAPLAADARFTDDSEAVLEGRPSEMPRGWK